MVDVDGKTTYSIVRFIHFNKDGEQVVLYLNPSNDVLNIKNNLSGKRIVITVSDAAGAAVVINRANILIYDYCKPAYLLITFSFTGTASASLFFCSSSIGLNGPYLCC